MVLSGNPLLLIKCRSLTGVSVRTNDSRKKKQRRHDGGRDGRGNDSEITAGRWLRLLPWTWLCLFVSFRLFVVAAPCTEICPYSSLVFCDQMTEPSLYWQFLLLLVISLLVFALLIFLIILVYTVLKKVWADIHCPILWQNLNKKSRINPFLFRLF